MLKILCFYLFQGPKIIKKTAKPSRIKKYTQFEEDLDQHFKQQKMVAVYNSAKQKSSLKNIVYTHEVMSTSIITLRDTQTTTHAKQIFKEKRILLVSRARFISHSIWS